MKFEDLLKALKNGNTFEEICRKQNNAMVECIENAVYEDEDLYEFLQELDAGIVEYGGDYVIIETAEGKAYKVPYEERPNRFGDDLSNEAVLFFEIDKICDVIENYAD